MKTYWNISKNLQPLTEWQPNCWIQVTAPSATEVRSLEEDYGLPGDFVTDIADVDERARCDSEDGWTLVILRIPFAKEMASRTPFTTIPLGILFKDDVIMTICHNECDVVKDFISFHQKRGEGFIDVVDMTFRLFLTSSVWYLKHLKQIGSRINQAKRALDDDINNESLVALSRLQDSLTYFMTSIRGNENLLQKLRFKLPVDELDIDLIEDVGIEVTQAREIAGIYSDILESTMDTYSNVINNNMNKTMRTLTAFSIVMMFPTIVGTIYGMNLINGLETNPYGMPIALGISVVASAAAWLVLKYKKLI
ncbi:MAG: magnesium transporter CorA family protein [Muribaculaceae bacterium]|nr:magnesium transporter CorA family protein [Muribaculaceae bacterium]